MRPPQWSSIAPPLTVQSNCRFRQTCFSNVIRPAGVKLFLECHITPRGQANMSKQLWKVVCVGSLPHLVPPFFIGGNVRTWHPLHLNGHGHICPNRCAFYQHAIRIAVIHAVHSHTGEARTDERAKLPLKWAKLREQIFATWKCSLHKKVDATVQLSGPCIMWAVRT